MELVVKNNYEEGHVMRYEWEFPGKEWEGLDG